MHVLISGAVSVVAIAVVWLAAGLAVMRFGPKSEMPHCRYPSHCPQCRGQVFVPTSAFSDAATALAMAPVFLLGVFIATWFLDPPGRRTSGLPF